MYTRFIKSLNTPFKIVHRFFFALLPPPQTPPFSLYRDIHYVTLCFSSSKLCTITLQLGGWFLLPFLKDAHNHF